MGAPDLLGFYPPLVRKGIFKGVDLNLLARRLWKLEAMRSEGPCPTFQWGAWSEIHWGGAAYPRSNRIRMRFGPPTTVAEAAEIVLHELVHCACPLKEHHGEIFRRRLIACAREAFGLDLDTAALLALKPGKEKNRAYAVDRVIMDAMETAGVGARLREDPEFRFEPRPPETELEREGREALALLKRQEVAAARVAAREKKARAKLAEWERKQAHAKRVAAKWRAKVRYYDRKLEAAKRGAR